MNTIYKKFLNSKDYTIITYNEIIDRLDELEITGISISNTDYLKRENGTTIEIEDTDYEHPFTLVRE